MKARLAYLATEPRPHPAQICNLPKLLQAMSQIYRMRIYIRGDFPARINAQPTIALPDVYGMTMSSWPSNEVISARLKIFYGADKPAIANFHIRKIGAQQ